MDFRAHTIVELAADVNEGRRTAESLVQAALQNIADHDAALNTFCAVDAERALASACLLYTSPSPRDATLSRMPSSA